jgi:hypothetical protein
MSVIYDNPTKQLRMQQVINQVDAGPAAGTLEIGTAAFATILAIFTCNDPCGTVTGAGTDTISFSGLPKSVTALLTGVAAVARFKDSTGVVRITGLTVGISGADVIIAPSTTITAGQTVDWVGGTIVHAA